MQQSYRANCVINAAHISKNSIVWWPVVWGGGIVGSKEYLYWIIKLY